MKVIITGTTRGIGKAIALKFLAEGHRVIGISRGVSSIQNSSYSHFRADISFPQYLPSIQGPIDILVNNAGVQTDTMEDIEVNLMGVVNCTKKYGLRSGIKSIVNIASTSAHNGACFPLYAASKGAVLAYTKNTALQVAQWGATCNSLSPGGVSTEMNKHILEDPTMTEAVMKETMLNKWAEPEEIAEWVYFLAVVNKSMTGQDVIIDNGELSKANFIW